VSGSLKEYQIKKAFESYLQGRVSLLKAASQAGLTYSGALEELKKRNIPFKYEKEDLDMDNYWALQEK
jgi:predicted HTH domain antitoxin